MLLFNSTLKAQIVIDGLFEDWDLIENNVVNFEDIDTDQTSPELDLLTFSVTNDSQYLYFKIEFNQEFDLTEIADDGALRLFLDLDNDPTTGFPATSSIGSELGLDLDNRQIFNDLNYPDFTTESTYFLDFIPCPTITSNTFEFMVKVGDLGLELNSIGIYFREDTFGDEAPNSGEPFIYEFQSSDLPNLGFISLEKNDENHIRLVAYNVHHDLIGTSSTNSIINILNSIDADIYSFSEVSEVSINQLQIHLNQNIDDVTWHIAKTNDVMCASRFPISESWSVTNKIGASLIDLPDDQYSSDLLSIYAHPPCCSNDAGRQYEFDAFASFINDAKSEGGEITIENETPIVFSGDMNLVGLSQQYYTIINGSISDEASWGPSAMPDWDNGPLTDAICRLNEFPSAHTWRKPTNNPAVGEYPPGRLDFIFYTSSVLNLEKSFTLSTERMGEENLSSYSLLSSDTFIASDHLPVVSDFTLVNSVIAECDTTAAYDQGYEDGFNAALEILQQCPGDFNLDGTITTTDLLHFLLLFGTVCE